MKHDLLSKRWLKRRNHACVHARCLFAIEQMALARRHVRWPVSDRSPDANLPVLLVQAHNVSREEIPTEHYLKSLESLTGAMTNSTGLRFENAHARLVPEGIGRDNRNKVRLTDVDT